MSARAFLGLGLLLSALSAQPDSPSPGGSQAPVQRLIAERGRQLAKVQRDERDFAADVREREKYCKDLYPSTAKLAGTPYVITRPCTPKKPSRYVFGITRPIKIV